jgi:radical SAM superfamily enzyme YgiQ (UPF0313 family)
MPSIGRRPEAPDDYVGSWQMEPLALAVLGGLTPPGHELSIADDRMEKIPYHVPTDLVAINVETFTARRAWQIADEYRKRGVKVVVGGFHPTLLPEEAAEHADAVMVGEAEDDWAQILLDAEKGELKQYYRSKARADLGKVMLDRSLFKGKGYLPIRLVESGRGCNYRCNFCSVTEFFKHEYVRRPVEMVTREIEGLDANLIFFVDDNIATYPEESMAFFKALKPLGIEWVSQATIDSCRDEALLDTLVESGCTGLLIGFESLSDANLAQMNKSANKRNGGYEKPLQNLRDRAIKIYATFLLGYDGDDAAALQRTLDFSLHHKFFLVAFNHLVPFPGTPLYKTFEEESRLIYDKWWLSDEYRVGDVAFRPKLMEPRELEEECARMRKEFYSWSNIYHRIDFGNNVTGWKSALMFYNLNRMLQREVSKKRGLPLGISGTGF